MHQKNKSCSIIWKLKAPAFQKTLELYHDQIILGRNCCVNLDNAVSLPPRSKLFTLFLNKNPFFTMKKEMTYTIGRVWLNLGCQHILILALNFFQRSGHHIIPISWKASYLFSSHLTQDTRTNYNILYLVERRTKAKLLYWLGNISLSITQFIGIGKKQLYISIDW